VIHSHQALLRIIMDLIAARVFGDSLDTSIEIGRAVQSIEPVSLDLGIRKFVRKPHCQGPKSPEQSPHRLLNELARGI
jgi:hypothetical protein